MIEWLSHYSGYAVLIGFFAAFIGIAGWTYRPANREALEKYRHIPFKEVE